MHREKGFSLIELLIVVTIILIIAAIAVPALLRSRISANEASAVASTRSINTAQVTYSVAYPQVGYADSLTKLAMPQPGQPVSANAASLLDWVLGCPQQPCPKSGYQFAIINATGSPVSAYEITAVPLSIGQTGFRGFCSSQLSVVKFDPNGGSNCNLYIQ